MSVTHSTTLVLWIVPLILQYAIAAAMLRRRLVATFPIFFCYTVWVPSRDAALFWMRFPSDLYAIVYWWGDALAVLLGLGAIVEAIRHIFPSHPFFRRFLGPVWTFGLIAAAISILILLSTPARGQDPTLEWIVLLERSARLLQTSMLIVVVALILVFGLGRHHYLVGIVVGFGVYSALYLAGLEFRAHLHFVTQPMIVLFNSVAYNVAAIIWAFYFLRPRRRDIVGRLPETDLVKWNEAVTEQIKQWYRH